MFDRMMVEATTRLDDLPPTWVDYSGVGDRLPELVSWLST